MTEPMTELDDWIIQTASEWEDGLRLGIFSNGERIQRQQLESLQNGNQDEKRFELESSIDTRNRYRCVVTDDGLVCLKYLQIIIPTNSKEFSHGEGELIVEIPANRHESFPTLSLSVVDAVSADVLLAGQRSQDNLSSVLSTRVAGLDIEKQRIKEFLTQSLASWGLRNETGMLLEGPPGTGKTELVKEVCEELYGGIPVIVSGPEVLSRWVGESEATIRRTFEKARNSPVPVLYIDEIDAIGSSRANSTQDHTAQLVSQLLVLLDGIESKINREQSSETLKVIASTNTIESLDAALTRPGRLGDGILSITRPGPHGRIAIFHHYLETIHSSADALDTQLKQVVSEAPNELPESLVNGTEDYTGADIEMIILTAARAAMRNNTQLTAKHLLTALSDTADYLPTQSAEPDDSKISGRQLSGFVPPAIDGDKNK